MNKNKKIAIFIAIVIAVVILGFIFPLKKTPMGNVEIIKGIPNENLAQMDIVADPETVKTSIESLNKKIIVGENDQQDTLFDKYRNVPYFLAFPNYLIVQDKIKFTQDLGYDVMRNILVSNYDKYVRVTAPKFQVLPDEDYSVSFIEAKIKIFQGQILSINKIIQQNLNIMNDNNKQDILVANAQGEKNIVSLQNTIDSFSDHNSENYKQSVVSVGAFIPPTSILIKKPLQSASLSELIRIMVHESLHYYSRANVGSDSPRLNELLYEGLTEYLTLKAIGYSEDEMIVVSGYPVHIQIIMLLGNKIPLSQLQDIHFMQNQDLFNQNFKRYFPNSDLNAFLDLGDQIDAWWYTDGFGQDNSSYVDNMFVIKAKKILGTIN